MRRVLATINPDGHPTAVTSQGMAESCSQLDVRTIARVAGDILRFVASMLRPHVQLAAENLFLRKQLTLYLERQVKPPRADGATRILLVALSQLVTGEQSHRFVVHDHDSIYSEAVDRTIAAMGWTVLKTPLIGTIRRECLDFVIPLNERRVQSVLRKWVAHYNRGRAVRKLGPRSTQPRGRRTSATRRGAHDT